MMYNVIAAIVSIAITLVLAKMGLTNYLGAHPVAWPFKVALIGAPIGAIVAIAAGFVARSKAVRLVLFLIFLIAAWGLAHYGKVQFAASYAEDQFAGKFWYFGWIATCAMFTSLIATLASRQKD